MAGLTAGFLLYALGQSRPAKSAELFVNGEGDDLPFSYEVPLSWLDKNGRPKTLTPGHFDLHSIRGPAGERLTVACKRSSVTPKQMLAEFAPSKKRYPDKYFSINGSGRIGFVLDFPYMKSPSSLYVIAKVLFKSGLLVTAQLTGSTLLNRRMEVVRSFVNIVRSMKPR